MKPFQDITTIVSLRTLIGALFMLTLVFFNHVHIRELTIVDLGDNGDP